MTTVLTTFAPIFMFMLLPVWIPIVAIAVGSIADSISPRQASPAEAAVADARERTLADRPSSAPSLAVEGLPTPVAA